VDWSVTIPGAEALCCGDWDNDGSDRVLVAAGQTLHVLDLAGTEVSTVRTDLSGRLTTIECGRDKTRGARLLAYSHWGDRVWVVDHSGHRLWNRSATFGVNDAHWGDLNGDGNDEMILGMNGFGGLDACSPSGKKLWSVSMANVWASAIVPATAQRPALVLATESSGSVNLFDSAGHRITTLRPMGGYFTELAARAVESNSIQILAFAANAAAAFDTNGTVAWSSFVTPATGTTRPCCAAGDLIGDGTTQWLFIDGGGDLVIVSASGKKLGWLANQAAIDSFAVAARRGRGGLLVTLAAGRLQGYSFNR
jgi:hypothetical protein